MASSPLEHLTELMRDPSLPVSVEWVDEMARLYPYMTLPAKLLLERSGDTLDESTRRRVMQQMALNSSSHEMLYRIADKKTYPMPISILPSNSRKLLIPTVLSRHSCRTTDVPIRRKTPCSNGLYSTPCLITR